MEAGTHSAVSKLKDDYSSKRNSSDLFQNLVKSKTHLALLNEKSQISAQIDGILKSLNSSENKSPFFLNFLEAIVQKYPNFSSKNTENITEFVTSMTKVFLEVDPVDE